MKANLVAMVGTKEDGHEAKPGSHGRYQEDGHEGKPGSHGWYQRRWA